MPATFPTRRTAVLACGAVIVATTGLVLAAHRPLHAAAPPPAAALPSAPLPASAALVSDAFVRAAAAVKPSVVYITAEVPAPEGETPVMAGMPPEFRRFFGMPEDGDEGPAPRQRRAMASGSGFIVSKDGYILTNAHVVDGATRVRVRLLDRREFPATIVGTDKATDVALLRIGATGLVPATFGSSDSSRVGEFVLAVGNPLGEELTFTVTEGIVSAKGRSLRLPNSSDRSIQDFIQTDAAINPGNSGGPLVDMEGRVIGINSAIASGTGYYSGYGFALPIDLARQVMRQLMEHGAVERAALGVQVRAADANDAAWAGLDGVHGVMIASPPEPGSAAAMAGLRAGDLVVGVDGVPVDYVAQLQERIGFRRPGDAVTLDVRRKGGERTTLNVRLTRLEDEATATRRADRTADAAPDHADRVHLGVTVAPLDEARATHRWRVPSNVSGLVVTGVEPGADAESHLVAPTERGVDVIVSIDGTAVHDATEVQRALRGKSAGTVVSLEVYNTAERTTRVERVRLAGPSAR